MTIDSSAHIPETPLFADNETPDVVPIEDRVAIIEIPNKNNKPSIWTVLRYIMQTYYKTASQYHLRLLVLMCVLDVVGPITIAVIFQLYAEGSALTAYWFIGYMCGGVVFNHYIVLPFFISLTRVSDGCANALICDTLSGLDAIPRSDAAGYMADITAGSRGAQISMRNASRNIPRLFQQIMSVAFAIMPVMWFNPSILALILFACSMFYVFILRERVKHTVEMHDADQCVQDTEYRRIAEITEQLNYYIPNNMMGGVITEIKDAQDALSASKNPLQNYLENTFYQIGLFINILRVLCMVMICPEMVFGGMPNVSTFFIMQLVWRMLDSLTSISNSTVITMQSVVIEWYPNLSVFAEFAYVVAGLRDVRTTPDITHLVPEMPSDIILKPKLYKLDASNGSGKSLFFQTVVGMIQNVPKLELRCEIDGCDRNSADTSHIITQEKISFLPQNGGAVSEHETLRKQFANSVEGVEGVASNTCDHLAKTLLSCVGIDRAMDMPAGAMSGGERQRIALALIFYRAITLKHELMLLDEAGSAMDIIYPFSVIINSLMDVCTDMNANMTVIVIDHTEGFKQTQQTLKRPCGVLGIKKHTKLKTRNVINLLSD